MKNILAAALILSMGNWLWCDLQDHYKKGEIVLKAIEGFGEGNDWEELFYDPYKEIAAAPDGSIFVVNSRTHNVFKFDKHGKFLKAFGRRGKGPGEHVYPGSPSILDNKYLVVGEYAANRRFTLWNLNGKYKKVVRTKTSIFYLTALRNNRAAYYTFNQHAKKTFRNFDFSTIFAKNLPLYKEILVDSEGNFLVFKFTPCQKNCNPIFQVYSREGKFICETKLNRGKYELEIDPRFKKICFTSEGIFGLFMNQGDEDEIFRLIKSNYPPAP